MEKEILQNILIIIRFDTKTEKFTEIAVPSLNYERTRSVCLTVVSGCLHMCMTSAGTWSPGKLEMWKMDGDGEWTEVVSCCHTLRRHVAYQPLHVMKNGNWLVSKGVVNYAYEVDLETKTTKKVCSYTPTPTVDGAMNTIWGGKFVETMVSLNR
ncbi:hypothetical protein OSB04_001072 [Centaurea solstitialis]|uniref:F-box associated domain-containing protein n=1 Tax=Centaurea solstitialis TaxID=347529 RepID=A0AA38U0W6_9ASTR|nr:hypothetical protein OSB04_001072 [Centaurea solstitialis]